MGSKRNSDYSMGGWGGWDEEEEDGEEEGGGCRIGPTRAEVH